MKAQTSNPGPTKYPSNESSLVKSIKKALEHQFGGFWFKTHGGLFQRAGLPDLLGCVKGRFCGLEVKLPGKEDTLSRLQQSTLKTISKAGGISGMVVSVEQALEILAAEFPGVLEDRKG